MRKIIAICAIILASVGVTAGLTSTPAAALTNCTLAGQSYPGGTYTGLICWDCCYAGTQVRQVAICQRWDASLGYYRTEIVWSPWVYQDTWTWLSCPSGYTFRSIVGQNR